MIRFQNSVLVLNANPAGFNAALANVFRVVVELPSKTGALMYEWQRRWEQRKQLRELPDSLLVDIGITRAQADREAAKPFWLS